MIPVHLFTSVTSSGCKCQSPAHPLQGIICTMTTRHLTGARGPLSLARLIISRSLISAFSAAAPRAVTLGTAQPCNLPVNRTPQASAAHWFEGRSIWRGPPLSVTCAAGECGRPSPPCCWDFRVGWWCRLWYFSAGGFICVLEVGLVPEVNSSAVSKVIFGRIHPVSSSLQGHIERQTHIQAYGQCGVTNSPFGGGGTWRSRRE